MSSSSIAKCEPQNHAAEVNQILKWTLTGATEHDIAEAARQAWPETDPQPLIAAAVKKLQEAGEFDHRIVYGWCFEATRDLYRRMVEIGDFPGALRAVRQLTQLAKMKPRAK